LSQGHKSKSEPSLFIPTNEVYGHIPKTHFYERLGELLDLTFVHELTKSLYAEKLGRPSLDPAVFFKCMLVAFFENIVYDTELEYRIADSLTVRRFLGYELNERTPDESTLRKTRQRMPEEVFKAVFDYVLEECQSHGLLKGRAIGTDSTPIDANASMDSLRHKELGCTYEEFVLALRRQDEPGASWEEAAAADKGREGKASNADWESATDPESRVAHHPDGHTHLSYKVDATVDLETGVIVSAGAELANVSDQADFLERVDEAVEALADRGLDPEVIVADKGHHSGENLVGIEERGLVALISSPNQNRGQPGFRRDDFVYEAETDRLICPEGQMLSRLSKKDQSSRHYKAKGNVCQGCPNFGVCTTNKRGRSVMISGHEELVKANRERVHSEGLRPLVQIRRQRGEAPFGYLKQFGGLRRFAGRGLAYAVKKTLIAVLGWNLLLLVKTLMRRTPRVGDAVSVLIWLVNSLWTRTKRLLAGILGRVSRTAPKPLRMATSPSSLLISVGKVLLSGGC
jgi:transposase